MGKADLPRLGMWPPPTSPCVGYGVMRGAKLALDDERLPFSIPATLNILDVSRASSKLNGGSTGEALGEHRLAGPGRTDHEHVVRAGRCDLQTPLCVFLALHVFKIQLVRGAGAPYRVQIGFTTGRSDRPLKIQRPRRGDLPHARKTED